MVFFSNLKKLTKKSFILNTRKMKNAEENAVKRSCNFMNVKISV
jgi:hypothetical protein